jgi:putative tricarboxylic transport membrane protein
MTNVASGDVRVLALTAPERTDILPDVPTLTELGYPAVIGNWRGVFAAPGTPPERIAQWGELIGRAVGSNSWQESLARYGWRSQVLLGDEFSAYLAKQESQLESVMNELGFNQ